MRSSSLVFTIAIITPHPRKRPDINSSFRYSSGRPGIRGNFTLDVVLRFSNNKYYMQKESAGLQSENIRIYNRLAVLRAERGLSRQALAQAVGVNYQTIGFLERGDYNPSLTLAFALSEYFGVP